MKIAYCIVCHRFTPVLEGLVRAVGAENDVWVHVDAKSNIGDFAPLRDAANFVGPRVEVTWGRYSQIEATLRLLDASRGSRCDYVALVSGDTLPLRSDAEAKRFLWANRGREFVYRLPLRAEHVARVRYRYPAPSVSTSLRRRLGLLPRNEYFDALPELSFGSNWFVVTPGLRDWFLDFPGGHPEFVEAFRHSNCGDELFFATVAAHSPFAGNLDARRYMYVEWQGGRPRTLSKGDFDRLEQVAREDHFLFARKFADDLDVGSYLERFGI